MTEAEEIKAIEDMKPGEFYRVSDSGKIYHYGLGKIRPTPDGEIGELREALERLIGASKTVAGYCDMLEPGTEIFAAIEQGSAALATKIDGE